MFWVTELDLLKKKLLHKWAKNRDFLFFFFFKGYFFSIWSIMKVYSICYIPAQVPYLGKIWFLIYWAIRLQDFKISYIFRTKCWSSLFFAWRYIHENWQFIEKLWGGCSQKWVLPLWSQDSKFGCVTKANC